MRRKQVGADVSREGVRIESGAARAQISPFSAASTSIDLARPTKEALRTRGTISWGISRASGVAAATLREDSGARKGLREHKAAAAVEKRTDAEPPRSSGASAPRHWQEDRGRKGQDKDRERDDRQQKSLEPKHPRTLTDAQPRR